MRWEYRIEIISGPFSRSDHLADMAQRLEASLNSDLPIVGPMDRIEDRMNAWGNEGWELVTIVTDDTSSRVAVFKRPK